MKCGIQPEPVNLFKLILLFCCCYMVNIQGGRLHRWFCKECDLLAFVYL